MDTIDIATDFLEDPDEDLADVIGGEGGIAMDFEVESDEELDDSIDSEEWVPRRHRRTLVRNRLVHSLDSCLDESKYDDYVVPGELREYKSIVEKPRRKTDVGKSITWTNRLEGRPTANVSTAVGCLIGDALSVNTEEMAWDLFMTSDMISKILHHTNQKIESIIAEISQRSTDNAKLASHIKVTDCIEIKSFFGLLYARGLLGQNKTLAYLSHH